MRFFDHFLKGEANGFDKEPPVLLTIRDPRGFTRRKENEWPLARTEWVKFALDAYEHIAGREERTGAALRRNIDALSEGVTFRSAPFAQDTEFTGPLAAKLFVSSSTTDLDLFLTLARVRPGRQGNHVQGRERSRSAGLAGLAARLAAQTRSRALEALSAVPSA